MLQRQQCLLRPYDDKGLVVVNIKEFAMAVLVPEQVGQADEKIDIVINVS